jgi:hypothetical protein
MGLRLFSENDSWCLSVITSTTTFLLFNSPPTSPSLQVPLSLPVTVTAHPIVVKWKSEDLSFFTPKSAPLLRSQPLSSGAKTGIIIAAVMVFFLIIICSLFFLWRRRRRNYRGPTEIPEHDGKPELEGQGVLDSRVRVMNELDTQGEEAIFELEAMHPRR